MKKSMHLMSWLVFVASPALLLCGVSFGALRPTATASSKVVADSALGSTSTLLPDGRVLIAGGADSKGRPQGTLIAIDPATGAASTLAVRLMVPRAGHTSSVLPDGTVLVLGGVGQDGNVVQIAERFDPISQSISAVPGSSAPSARAFHSATLLTDGRLLIAGGILANSSPASSIELWDPRGKNSEVVGATVFARRNHRATLLADGRVLFSGGQDSHGNREVDQQIFDPQSRDLISARNDSSERLSNALTEVRASSPEDGAQNISLDTLISVRFSQPVQMRSISGATLTLVGPGGMVDANVVAAEGGMLAFITPNAPLSAATTYSVKVSGATDQANQTVAFMQFVFTTAGAAGTGSGSGIADDEQWTPTSDWRTHRNPSESESLPDYESSKGDTALAGQVLRLNGKPLAHVTLEINQKRTESDESGRFLLTGIPAGHQVLVIEGRTANKPGKTYGRFEFGAEIRKGVTNHLSFKIWMPLLDMAHEVTIPSPTTRETVVTTPALPGLELHLPPGTTITDHEGKVVTKITITPVPLDRTPFPLPFIEVPLYFTIQPGGAYIHVRNGSGGARLFYPNRGHLRPGIPFAFWNYNPDHNGWYAYGVGRVDASGRTIVPNPGVVIYEFSGAMVGSNSPGPTTQDPIGDHPKDGEPVTLSSGLFVYEKNDLFLPDVIPLLLTRTYRPNDSWSRPFGIGTTHPYEIFIGGNGQTFGSTPFVELILADGSRVRFDGVGPGPSYQSYLHVASNTSWYGATLSGTPVNPNNYLLPGEWQLQTRDGTIYSFPSSDGQVNPGCQALVGITDRYGNQVKIARSPYPACAITQLTSPSGRSISFQYDTSNRVTSATDSTGRVVQYSYDGSGRLSTVTDANNGVWVYTYDDQARMLTIQDARQIVYLTNQYDSAGRVIKQTQADTGTYQFAWTPAPQTTNITFSVSGGTSAPAAGGSVSAVQTFRSCNICSEGYLPLISQVDVTHPNGSIRRVVFNQNGYTTSDTQALGKPEQQTTTYTYFADNLLSSSTDQLGRVTNYVFDAYGNPTQITQLSGTANAVTISASYDSFSQPTSITDPLNHATTISRDTFGNAISIFDPLGNQTSMTYNSRGQVLTVTDPLQHTTQFGYDFADLISITDPVQNQTILFNDGAGRLTTRTDPLGHTTKYQYNNLNQVTQITDPLQGVTTFSYDANGNLLTVQDARQQGTNNKTSYTYDNMDRLQTRTDPLLRQETYSYDFDGNLTSFTDRRGKVSTFQYDGLDRLTFAGYGTTAGPTYESTINYSYDGGDRLTQVVDSASGTITPAFDGLDRLTSETTPRGSIGYTYDAAGRRTSATVAGQSSVCYSYDNASRLTGIGQGTCPTATSAVGFTYDNASRRSTMTLPNGIVLTYGYDSDSRIGSMSYKLGSNVLGNLSYTYDAAGRRTQVGGSLSGTGFPAALGSATYDTANELVNWGGSTVSYDANGNMVGDSVHTYSWNARNQLAMIDSGTTASFAYDGYGRRASKTVLGSQTGFLYDGRNPVQELAGTTPTANLLTGGLDEYFSRTDTNGARSFLTDALGSTLALTDGTGALQTQYLFDPFGNTTTSGAASTNAFQYTGRENDGSGLYFLRARYYNPLLARFISEDPVGWQGGLNFYQYGGDNPVSLSDPLGLSPLNGRNCKNCPTVPPHPGYANIDDNISWARNHRFAIYNFFTLVRGRGPWDYKQDATLNEFGNLNPRPTPPSAYEDFGNFNYGATGAALGLSPEILLIGAGWQATRSHPESAGTTWQNLFNLAGADDFNDQIMIMAGYEYYQQGCHQ